MPASYLRVLFAALLCGAASLGAAETRPNVLFIAIDDLNDWVGVLGGHPQVQTPHVDALARRGVLFTNAHCASPICGPSRAAVFSGRQPYRSGVYTNADDLRKVAPDLVLLPQHFQRHGYATWGTGKLLHQRRGDLFQESFFPEQRWSPFAPAEVRYTLEELPSKGSPRPRKAIDRGPDQPPIILPMNGMPRTR